MYLFPFVLQRYKKIVVAKSILSKRMLTNIIFLHSISIMLSVSCKLTKHYLTLNINMNIYA